jgi:hypothetical protein
MVRTPYRSDKRHHMVSATVALLFLFIWFGKIPPEIGVTAIVTLVGGYVGFSQWGQTKRTEVLQPAAEGDVAAPG